MTAIIWPQATMAACTLLHGIPVLRTDRQGHLMMSTDGITWTYDPEPIEDYSTNDGAMDGEGGNREDGGLSYGPLQPIPTDGFSERNGMLQQVTTIETPGEEWAPLQRTEP